MMGWYCRYISRSNTLGDLPWGLALSNIKTRDLNDSMWEFGSVTSGIAGSGFLRAQINSCEA